MRCVYDGFQVCVVVWIYEVLVVRYVYGGFQTCMCMVVWVWWM